MDSWKPLRPNIRKGDMKKVLEEEKAARSNYATTTGICVGESSGAKTSFWPELLENPKKTNSNEIRRHRTTKRIFASGITRNSKEGVPPSSRGSRKKKKTNYGAKCSKGKCRHGFNE